MKFQLTKDEIVELAGRKWFPELYLECLQDYYYDLRHDKESIWEYLEIDDVNIN